MIQRTPTALAALAALILIALSIALCCLRVGTPESPRLATFNIEQYPKHPEQERAALALIASLDAQAVALQEITQPERFAEAARLHLGPSWTTVFASGGPSLRVGLLVDQRAFAVDGAWTHTDTMITPRDRPTLEVRLLPRRTKRGGDVAPEQGLRVLVVHLKATGHGLSRRREQYAALSRLLARARVTGDEVAVLGDFNATEPEDRQLLQRLAREHRVGWVTRGLRCTSYWARSDGCRSSSLDHGLSSVPTRRVFTAGPCGAWRGCEPGDHCPLYCRQVSDHCPVVLDLRGRKW